MKRNLKWILAMALIGGATIWKKNLQAQSLADSESAAPPTNLASKMEAAQPIVMKNSPGAKAGDLDPAPLESLQDMTKTLYQFTRPDSQLSDLVQYLESSRQQPQIARNSNPDTGEQVIIRTRSPLPGTRYFHAQYFTGENQKSFVQHMSFEFKPSESAMNSAIDAIQNSFPDLPSPHVRDSNFIQWNVGGYVLWIKKMAASDLQDDPFNAYSDEDVGTIRVAMELEIHGAEDAH